MSGLGLSRGLRIEHGKYLLTQCLGSGGMGEVWEAFDQQLHRHVALKFLRENELDGNETSRVVVEARHTLLHEHIVRVYGLGLLNEHAPFLVMERLVGRTLRQEIHAQGRLSVSRTANILLPIICAVGAAHAARIVHRDLKPGNIFLLDRPDAIDQSKLLDFGISKRLSPGGDDSAEGSGTPGYRSPEQAGLGGRLDFATDVWALGVVLYECLSGERLWANSELKSEIGVLSSDDAFSKVREAVSNLPVDVPFEVREVIQGALQLAPSNRLTLERMFDLLSPFATIVVPSFSTPLVVSGRDWRDGPPGQADEATMTHSATHSQKFVEQPDTHLGETADYSHERESSRKAFNNHALVASAVAASGILGLAIGRTSLPTTITRPTREPTIAHDSNIKPIPTANESPSPSPNDTTAQGGPANKAPSSSLKSRVMHTTSYVSTNAITSNAAAIKPANSTSDRPNKGTMPVGDTKSRGQHVPHGPRGMTHEGPQIKNSPSQLVSELFDSRKRNDKQQ